MYFFVGVNCKSIASLAVNRCTNDNIAILQNTAQMLYCNRGGEYDASAIIQ